MKPPMCYRHPGIKPNLTAYSMCLVCQFNSGCISIDPPPPPKQESEWKCTSCDDTECRFTINANLKTIQPVRCPLSGMEGRLEGLNQHWVRLK